MRFMTNLQKNTRRTQIRFPEFGSFAWGCCVQWIVGSCSSGRARPIVIRHLRGVNVEVGGVIRYVGSESGSEVIPVSGLCSDAWTKMQTFAYWRAVRARFAILNRLILLVSW